MELLHFTMDSITVQLLMHWGQSGGVSGTRLMLNMHRTTKGLVYCTQYVYVHTYVYITHTYICT